MHAAIDADVAGQAVALHRRDDAGLDVETEPLGGLRALTGQQRPVPLLRHQIDQRTVHVDDYLRFRRTRIVSRSEMAHLGQGLSDTRRSQ